jgi:hypothetical protein
MTPFFSYAPVVTMEIGVTSEPVPAVVQRQALPADFAHSIDIIERFVAFAEQSHKFCDIKRRAAADAKYTRGAETDRLRHSRMNDSVRRVGDNTGEDRYFSAAVRKACQGRLNEPRFDDPIVRNHHDARSKPGFRQLRKPRDATRSRDDLRDGRECECGHLAGLSLMPFDERLIVMRLAHDDKILSPDDVRRIRRFEIGGVDGC